MSVATRVSGNLTGTLLDRIAALPDGEKIYQCIQCGTCSASCPMSEAMDYSPRAIVAALRANQAREVLDSNTVWLCSSCYSCAVRCPAGIPFTDVMYELRRFSLKASTPGKAPRNAVMARAFVESVTNHGRAHEPEMVRKYFLRTNPFGGVAQVPFGLRMMQRGRLPLLAHNVKGIGDLRKMLAAVKEKRAND